MRFSSTAGRRDCPPALREPFGRRAWEEMSGASRRQHIEFRVIQAPAGEDDPLNGTLRPFVEASERARSKAAQAVVAKRLSQGATAARAAEKADPVEPSSPYVVACAGGCGAMLPALGPRSIVAYCEGYCRLRTAGKHALGMH
jgi:hypothetical protein